MPELIRQPINRKHIEPRRPLAKPLGEKGAQATPLVVTFSSPSRYPTATTPPVIYQAQSCHSQCRQGNKIHRNARVVTRPTQRINLYVLYLRCIIYRRFPGTKMNSTISATPTRIVMAKTIVARLFRSFLTKGSLTRDQFMNVYSLKPRRARIGSMEYCCEAMQ